MANFVEFTFHVSGGETAGNVAVNPETISHVNDLGEYCDLVKINGNCVSVAGTYENVVQKLKFGNS